LTQLGYQIKKKESAFLSHKTDLAMDAVAFIFARAGSKGIPQKNLIPLGGKPLLAWSIEHAKAVSRIRRVIVSTDSKEIAEVAKTYGAETPFLRPARLATDKAPEWLAWQHAIKWLAENEKKYPDAMVSIPTTSPFRSVYDIENCLDRFKKNKFDAIITVTPSKRSPYFNLVKQNPNQTFSLFSFSKKNYHRRQNCPPVFDITTSVYVVRPKFVLQKKSLFEGLVGAIEVPNRRALDIDTEEDYMFARYLFSKQKPK